MEYGDLGLPLPGAGEVGQMPLLGHDLTLVTCRSEERAPQKNNGFLPFAAALSFLPKIATCGEVPGFEGFSAVESGSVTVSAAERGEQTGEPTS